MNQNTNDSGRAAAPLCDEARVLARLLAGGVDAVPCEVLAALADLPSAVARRHLEHLVRTGQAFRDTGGYAVVDGACTQEPLTPDLAAWARVTDWYLACVYRAAEALGSAALPGGERIEAPADRAALAPRNTAEAIAWYHAGHTALLSVLDRAVAAGDYSRAWRLALLTLNVAAVAGPAGDWEEVVDLGLSAAWSDLASGSGPVAMVMEYQAKLLVHAGAFEDARAVHGAALALREEAGDLLGAARSINGLGLVALREGDLDTAAGLFDRAGIAAVAAGSAEFGAYARLNLGAALVELGRVGEARELLEQAEAYLREAGRGNYLADTLHRLAATHRAQGDHARALVVVTEAIHEATCTGLPMYLAGPLSEFAEILLALGDTTGARAGFAEARGIYADLGDVVRAVRIEARIAPRI
jgi:tetratricopeptide (TPR) repeat protein